MALERLLVSWAWVRPGVIWINTTLPITIRIKIKITIKKALTMT
jgi:hypothetical protein